MCRRTAALLSVSFYDPPTKQFASIFPNQDPEAVYALPRFTLLPLNGTELDSDHDGLPDVVENVYGTDPTNPDSDGDGIPDGAEVDAGTNPLDGRAVITGVIATVKTPGAAVDVAAANDLVVTAEGPSGVSIFNAYRGRLPRSWRRCRRPAARSGLPSPGTSSRVRMVTVAWW